MQIFDIVGIPLGYVLWFIYKFVSNYFVAIFLFTLLVRAATFPLSLKSQKAQADRAKLAPRLERIQKKYAQDKQKLQQKQMELYEKEGVSMTGGCLPLLVQMVILFGIISVIYSPLTHLVRIPAPVVNATVSAVTRPTVKDENGKEVLDPAYPEKVDPAHLTGYYKELNTLKALETNKEDVLAAIGNLSDADRQGKSAQEYYDQMIDIKDDFSFFGGTLLENPWNDRGFAGINILWLIPLISGLTALASSLISMRYTKQLTPGGEQVPGQGCNNVLLMVLMPTFSLFITFTVPGGVGVYWICSNIIAVIQTIILNSIYNPAKIRAQAEAEYQERRRQKAEDKKRLKEARIREEAEAQRLAKEEAEAKEKARQEEEAARKKPVEPSKNPNKIKRREAAEKVQAAGEEEASSETAKSEEAAEVAAEEEPGNGHLPKDFSK